LPAAEFYPVAAIQAAAEQALQKHGTSALEYGAVEGFTALRKLIAERISKETGGQFTAANVLLTTGAMQGMKLTRKNGRLSF
jgi:2-aminoadipate transaminase